MGGGSEVEWTAVEELEALAANIFQLCDVVAYGISLREVRAALDKDYSHLDELLASLGESLPFVVANCAAHVTAVHRLRQLAHRYKELEVSTHGHLEGARRLGEGLAELLLGPSPLALGEAQRPRALVDALRRRSPSIRQALSLLVERMQTVAQMLMATAAAHLAVSRDMDVLVSDAAGFVENPVASDIGLQAAPIIGATAAGSLGLVLLRGALGPLGAVALGSLGALGAKELTEAKIVPQVKEAFQRVYDEASQVSSLIDSKASALDVIAADMMSASVVIEQLTAMSVHARPSEPADALAGPTEELEASVAALLLRCRSCSQRLTAFMALTYKLQPKGERRPFFAVPPFVAPRQPGAEAELKVL